MKRRHLLGTCGAVLCLAGCPTTTEQPTETETTTTEADTSTPTPDSELLPRRLSSPIDDLGAQCDDATFLSTGFVGDVGYDHEHFRLEATPDTVQVGQDLTITLENTSEVPQNTGNSSKYFVYYDGPNGLEPVANEAPIQSPSFDDDAVLHQPGGGFAWTGEVSQEGFSRRISNGSGAFVVCSPLEPGQYHFVYWGLGNSPALGTRFSVVP